MSTKPATRGECGTVGCTAPADLETTTRVAVSTWEVRLDCFDHAPLHVLAAADQAASE